jgi:signal transduction histidine kinase
LSNIRPLISIEPAVPPIIGDFNQLQQCVINLIFNAIDAMPDGGTLTLSGRYAAPNGQVHIIVGDNGPGITPEDLPHIFEPFFTTKNEGFGVGLGLSTVYGIVERHDGKVIVDSRKGQGSTFTIELPVMRAAR